MDEIHLQQASTGRILLYTFRIFSHNFFSIAAGKLRNLTLYFSTKVHNRIEAGKLTWPFNDCSAIYVRGTRLSRSWMNVSDHYSAEISIATACFLWHTVALQFPCGCIHRAFVTSFVADLMVRQ